MSALPRCGLQVARAIVAVLALCASMAPAQAHLMVAQKGTLNFHQGGAYLLLSLPVSALRGADDDGDGLLGAAELQKHAAGIEQQIRDGIQLLDQDRALRLEGLLMSLSPPDSAPGSPASQLVVMGRYAIDPDPHGSAMRDHRFRLDLFGRAATEQAYDITFTQGPRTQVSRFTPGHPSQSPFPSAREVVVDHLRSGAAHVLAGADHLLFLLVVLAGLQAARPGWRHAVWVLSCFTAGHAVTLAATLHGALKIAPTVVEPAIAATIVGMACFDLLQRRRGGSPSAGMQRLLVFACALVHGLGLAGAANDRGLAGAALVWGLLGFNLGIEAAQLAVAAGAVVVAGALHRVLGPDSPARAAQAASVSAALIGMWWFVDRIGGQT